MNPQRIRLESWGILAQTARRSRPGSRSRASGIPGAYERLGILRESQGNAKGMLANPKGIPRKPSESEGTLRNPKESYRILCES
eukprot:7667199-Pyramimonas_sp.AAC.1